MRPYIPLFGPAHLFILIEVPTLAAILALIHRRSSPGSRTVRLGLASILLADTIVFYWYQITHRLLSFPGHMPLELCDLSLVLVILALLSLNKLVFDLAYYLALGGATMALVTPNLWEPFPSFGTVQFFVAHGLTVAGVLFLVWSGLGRPRPGSIGRAFIGLNIFASLVGVFNALFHTINMYLSAKPLNASLLDLLGPWPWYIGVCEIVGLSIFVLLYLPFRTGNSRSKVDRA